MRLPTVTDIRRLCGDALLASLDHMAYTGSFDCQALGTISTSVSRRWMDKGGYYYIASLYLQLGEADKASDLLRSAGRPSAEMKYFLMVLQHSKTAGLPLPKLNCSELKCLQYLQQHYCDSVSIAGVGSENKCVTWQDNCSGLQDLFRSTDYFAVVGNAPYNRARTESATESATASVADDNRIVLKADCASVCFNNYAVNPRIVGDASIHVVTPSWHFDPPHPDQHLVITGNSVFYRRSRVWQKFLDCPRCAGIHTLPRSLWSGLVEELQASPSAGLLFLAFLDSHCDLTNRHGLIAGFSSNLPTQNHSYDEVPLSDRHDWIREIPMRQRIEKNIQQKASSLKIE